MATRRRSRRRDGFLAWAGTALVGLVLVVGGFGAGVLLGVVSEEPAALTGLLTGRTERIALPRRDEASPARGPEKPAEERVVRTKPARQARSQPERRPLPAVSAAPTGYAVQVGAFASSKAARAMKSKLASNGYESFVAAGAATRDHRWRVRVGPFSSRNEADRAAGQLGLREGLSTWVVRLDERNRN